MLRKGVRYFTFLLGSALILSCGHKAEDPTQKRIDELFSHVDDQHYIDTLYSPLTKNDQGEEVSVIIGLRMYNLAGQQDGPTLVIDTKGVIREEKHYRDGINHGPFIRYTPDGILDQEVHFRNGLLDSMGTRNFEDGSLRTKLMMYNNGPGGNSVEYWENGNLKLYSFVVPSGTEMYRIEYNEEGKILKETGKLMQMFLIVGRDSIPVGEPLDLTTIVTDLPYLPVERANAQYVLSKKDGEQWLEIERFPARFSMGWDRVQIPFYEVGEYQIKSEVDFRRNEANGSTDSVLVTSNSFKVYADSTAAPLQ